MRAVVGEVADQLQLRKLDAFVDVKRVVIVPVEDKVVGPVRHYMFIFILKNEKEQQNQ